MNPLSVSEFKEKINKEDVYILDTRNPTLFTQGFIPKSVNIFFNDKFGHWATELIDKEKNIILVCEDEQAVSNIAILKQLGYEHILGYLEGGFSSWQNANEDIDLIIDVDAYELKMDLPFDIHLRLLDVREISEFDASHVKTALSFPLSNMKDVTIISQFEDHENIYLHCGGGYRSVTAASIFKKEGFHNVRNILGGFSSIKEIKEIVLVEEKKN